MLGATPAFAAAPTATVTAATSPLIPRNATTAAGSETVVFGTGSTIVGGDSLRLAVQDSSGSSSTVNFSAAAAAGTFCTAFTCTVTFAGNLLIIKTTSGGTITAGNNTISITGISYAVGAASGGSVQVFAGYNATPPPNTTGFVTTAASNAIIDGPGAGSSVTASSFPSILATGVNQPAGNLVVNLTAKTSWATGDKVRITVADSANGANITWDHAPTVTWAVGGGDTQLCLANPCAPANVTLVAGNKTVQINLDGLGQNNVPSGETLTLSNIGLTTAGAASGPVHIWAGWNTFPGVAGPNSGFTTGLPAANAVVGAKPTASLTAVTTPNITLGASNQPAGNWKINLKTINTSWGAGDKITIPIADNSGANCYANPTPAALAAVGFSGVPTATVTAIPGGATAVPTLSVALAQSGACTGSAFKDVLVLAFTNAGTITSGAGSPITISVTGVTLTSSPVAKQGNISVAAAYNGAVFQVPSTTGAAGGPSNATIIAVTLGANVPPSAPIVLSQYGVGGVARNEAINAPISPITATESVAGALFGGVNGYTCVSLNGGVVFDAASAPKVAASSGSGMTVSSAVLETQGTTGGFKTVEFQVLSASSSPATITLSNLGVDVPSTFIGPITGTITYGSTDASCTGGATKVGPIAIGVPLGFVSNRLWGQSADATAAGVCQAKIGFTGGVPNGFSPANGFTAVIVTDTNPWDALTANSLAGKLGTCVLTTPTNSLAPELLDTLRSEGARTVDVVGGPLVVSQADITQLQGTPQYLVGGTTTRVNPFTGQPYTLIVNWIYGQTQADTANQVAQYLGVGSIGAGVYQAAYGTSMYNDTTGSNGSPASAAPNNAPGVRTAIVVTDLTWQDAAGGSSVSYANAFPILYTDPNGLTQGAIQALQNLNIQQVIVLGGPLSVSDAVLTQLQGMGIAVLRIAGTDYTDTSTKLATFDMNNVTSTGQSVGLDAEAGNIANAASQIGVCRGDFYTDCMVAGQWLAGLPLVLTTDPNTLSSADTAFFTSLQLASTAPDGLTIGAFPGDGSVNDAMFFGGPLAISSTTANTVANDLNP
ncbi:MAG: beta strand repeat-containing protein [Acidimicrobiales bacterium]